jgi:glycosyltransferase involved in cell wall biosynthesis
VGSPASQSPGRAVSSAEPDGLAFSEPANPTSAEVLVSIVIPTYNSRQLLSACVDSIRAQTFSDYEIVVVDGASQDGTVALIEELAAKYSNVRWQSGKDQGVYDAMNKGVRLAQGRWLLFLGADDRLHSRTVLEQLAPHLREDLDFVYGDVALVNDPWGRDGTIYGGEFSAADLASRNICHQSIFYARSLFSRFGSYNQKYRAFADWDLNLRLFGKVRKKHVPITVADFHGGGLSSTNDDPEFHLRFIEIITRELSLDSDSEIYRGHARSLRRLLRHYLLTGRFVAAAKYFPLWLRHERFWRAKSL